MNFLCPGCHTNLSRAPGETVVACTGCGLDVDLSRVDTAPGRAHLWPEVDLSGESLGPYRLLERIGSGGMGTVYAAEGATGKCAVKVLSALLAADPAVRERFRREASQLRGFDLDGVVRVIEDGEERGFCWLAMERVEGPDLRARLKEGRLGFPEIESIARRLLTTLDRVHAAGWVHRDVKPSNILLDRGVPRLCDFGVARFDGARTLTESAALLGSLRYMAPEQRRGQAGPAADLYSTGLVLFEAVAGGVPGEATLPKGTPRALRRLIGRLLAEDPLGRPRSGAAAVRLLDRARWPIPAAAAGLAALGGVSLLLAREPNAGQARMVASKIETVVEVGRDSPSNTATVARARSATTSSTTAPTALTATKEQVMPKIATARPKMAKPKPLARTDPDLAGKKKKRPSKSSLRE
jgi:serine/threonine-protein kinase